MLAAIFSMIGALKGVKRKKESNEMSTYTKNSDTSAHRGLPYNYDHFSASDYDLENFSGPAVGEKGLDFQATTLDGKQVKLSDFFGKIIVLETGSITCPQYVSNIRPMNSLAEKHPDVVSLLLYVREAHPGSQIPAHRSLEDKHSRAEQTRRAESEKRTMLLDDIEGTAHQAYGSLPDMVYVINPEGIVAFRGRWTDPEAIETVIERLKSGTKTVTDVKAKFSPGSPSAGFRTLGRAGWRAMLDVAISLPYLVYQHLKVGRYSS